MRREDSLVMKRIVLSAEDMQRIIRRLAHEIVEGARGQLEKTVLIGVRTRGVPLARRLQKIIAQAEEVELAVGELDIALYRDDVFHGMALPEVRPTLLPFDIAGKHVVLVDDVLYTGRTVRAALDAIVDWGRPGRIQLVSLVDRGHRELPVQADYLGLSLDTMMHESVEVRLMETDDEDSVLLWGREQVEA